MKHRVLNLLVLVSLLLCVATVVMWVRSYRVGERWAVRRDVTTNGVSHLYRATADSTRGSVEIIIESGAARSPCRDESYTRHSSGRAYELPFTDRNDTTLERLGLRFSRGHCESIHTLSTPGGKNVYLNFPYCWPAAVLAAPPFWWARRRSRQPLSAPPLPA